MANKSILTQKYKTKLMNQSEIFSKNLQTLLNYFLMEFKNTCPPPRTAAANFPRSRFGTQEANKTLNDGNKTPPDKPIAIRITINAK